MAAGQLLSNNLILVGQYALSASVPLLLIPHIVKSIGLQAYGELAVALAWANYASVLVQYGFQYTGPTRLMQRKDGDCVRSVFADVALAKGLLLVPALIAMAAVALFGAGTAGLWLPLVGLPIAAALNAGWYLQSVGRFSLQCAAVFAGVAVALCYGMLAVTGSEPRANMHAAAALTSAPLVGASATLLAALWLLRSEPPAVRRARPLQALREGWPLYASQFTSSLYTSSGPLIVAFAAGSAAAGAYSAVERVTVAVLGACMLTHTAAYPKLVSLYGRNRRGYWRLMKTITLVYLGLVLTVAVVVATWIDSISSYLFGGAPPPDARLLVLCAWAWLGVGLFGTAYTGYLTVSGRQREVWPLTVKILSLAIIIGLPGTLWLGAWAWMAALSLSQWPVLHAMAKAWRNESRQLQSNGI